MFIKFFVLKVLMFFDFFHKRKIADALRNLLKNKHAIIFDVGGHHGESIFFFKKNFNIAKIYTFEPLESNFIKLKKNTTKISHKIIYSKFVWVKKEEKKIKEMVETSSSTLNEINMQSSYYKRKKYFRAQDKKCFQRRTLNKEGIDIITKFRINKVDLLKIDTEGYEYNVIKGFGKSIQNINTIIFEHHYDLMIKKEYKYSDINRYLINKGFHLRHKFKMPFRKSFEYIYSK